MFLLVCLSKNPDTNTTAKTNMMRWIKKVLLSILVYTLTQGSLLYAHGFSATTVIHTSEGWYYLNSLAELLLGSKIVYNVDSSPAHTATQKEILITHIAHGSSNCYIRFAIGSQDADIICCSPLQKFYLPIRDSWKEARHLAIGDELLTRFNQHKKICSVELVQQSIELYALAVPEPHIFCIGKHSIVTHNMIIPGIMLSVSVPWGFEAGLVSMASFLGPATLGISLIVGGVSALIYKFCSHRPSVHQYKLTFDTAALTDTVSNNQLHHNTLSLANRQNDPSCVCGHACNSTCSCVCCCPCGERKINNNSTPTDATCDIFKTTIFEKNAKHIFRNAPGHLSDTAINRKMLMELASDQKNYLGLDTYGNRWFAKTLCDGQQIWASVRGNFIRNGGLNSTPKSFNTTTGLCNL